MSSKRFNNTNKDFAGFSEADFEEVIQLSDMAAPANTNNTDFLATIAPPVLSQPQAFTNAMLDPTSRSVMTEIPLTHMNGEKLQRKLRQSADRLQRTVHSQFAFNKGNMSYKDLLAGLIYEGENFQTLNNFTFMNYTSLQFCDESGTLVNQRSGGICLLTNKRILFLSSQLAVGASLVQRGDPKTLPGGYTIRSSCNDTTYYLPIPLRYLRSVEMAGGTGVIGEVTVDGVAPCCFGLCESCALSCCLDSNMLRQWRAQSISRSQVQEMERVNMDFLATIAPPVVSQPQAFTDAMLDPTSRGLLAGLTTAHMSGAILQTTLRQSADQLQRTVQGQFVSLKGNMSYKDLLAGLIYEGETFQALNNFTFMNYTNLQFCDESGNTVNQRSGGICLLTNKRILFLSSQLAIGTSLVQWGDVKKLPGGYSLNTSCNDTTYYLPIPLRCLRSVEMAGETGVRGELSVHGVAPCCWGLCGLCGTWGCCENIGALKQWRPQPIGRSQVQEMRVTVGLLMPPWERRMFVHIHIDPNVPLPVTRDFVALLQKNSPGLS